MKKLEELGISPAPWKYIGYHYHKNGEYIHLGEVWVERGKHRIVVDISQPDAKIMSAAPDMYEVLFEALPWLADIGAEVVGNEAAAKIAAVVKKGEAALAKAAGEVSDGH